MASDDLSDRVAALERDVRRLQAELDERSDRRRPRLRPPTPGEVVGFSREYAIPTALAALEANRRALELLDAGLRTLEPAADGRSAAGDRGSTSSRATRASEAALARLEDALADVQTPADAEDTPIDPAAAELLREARDIRAEIERRRTDATAPISDESSGGVSIDVEEELRTIRNDVDESDDGDDGDDAE